MSKDTEIQWTDSSANPVMGCQGCELWTEKFRRCYAGILHGRYSRSSKGYAKEFLKPEMFAGRMEKAAAWGDMRGITREGKPWIPPHMPRMIFLSDMGDALSKTIPFEFLEREIIDNVTSEKGRRHTYQWLTKWPKRMAEFCDWLRTRGREWPMNLWPGTSITMPKAMIRAKHLQNVGTARTTRFLSCEPILIPYRMNLDDLAGISQVIIGGLSGTDVRSTFVADIRNLIGDARLAGCKVFVKQLGSKVEDENGVWSLRDSHGGDWNEWPEELRVREFPDAVPEMAKPELFQ